MTENRTKEEFMAEPIENHTTAAWANIEETKPLSNVAIPNEQEVIEAREWVNVNQK